MKKILMLVCILGIIGVSCAKKEEDDSSTSSKSYSGPGSDYDLTISSSSFDLKENDSGMEISGKVESLDSGFKRLTVESATGSGAPSVGDKAYGLDLPGIVFFLKPMEANSEIIPMVKAGTCPTGSLNMNWVITKLDINADADDNTGPDIYGTFTTDGSSASLPKKFYHDDSDAGTNQSLGSFTCSNGEASVNSGEAKMYLTASGGAIVRTGLNTSSEDDDGIIFAMPGATVASNDLDGKSFVGLAFVNNDTIPVRATVSGNAISLEQVDPDTDTAGSSSFTINLDAFDSPVTGISTGEISGTNTENAICNVNLDLSSSGKTFVHCSGADPEDGDATKGLFSVALIEK